MKFFQLINEYYKKCFKKRLPEINYEFFFISENIDIISFGIIKNAENNIKTNQSFRKSRTKEITEIIKKLLN